MIISVFRSSLRIRSKANALEFYDCVKHCMTIPYCDEYVIRVEPNNLISVVSKEDIKNGFAWAVPNLKDEDGSIAYSYRKYINAWLGR